MITKGLMSSNRDDWRTPRELFRSLDEEFKFTLDPASTDENCLCEKHYTKREDGLRQPRRGERVFCNPPYGQEIGKWVRKAYFETREGGCPLAVLLLPARTDTRCFHDYILHSSDIRFIRGRLRFDDGAKSAPFPSMIVIMRCPNADQK